jgi:oxygen-independent coproporphyrinogen-3 oxidase
MTEYQKQRLQRAKQFANGKPLPWGDFTGVHPIRFIRENKDRIHEYKISKDKLKLADEIIEVQSKLMQIQTPTHLYVGIPFCPSRCKYCSFVSEAVENVRFSKLIPQYMDLLIKELEMFLENKEYNFSSIYIGGGTPTSIPVNQLERLLEAVGRFCNFDYFSDIKEYTIEAGRPETITDEVLKVIVRSKATRISINPQSMNDDVLREIGRGHTVKDIYSAYERVRSSSSLVINMDLIMLPDFENSLNKVIELKPDNITVHSLARKRAASYKGESTDYTKSAYDTLKEHGYFPYYLYRQSNSSGDNIGYTRHLDNANLYNIYMMDESSTVIGTGCGAASRVFKDGKTNKHYNFKYPYEYINRFNEII